MALQLIGTAVFTGLSMWAAYRAQEDQRRTQLSLLNAQWAQAKEQIDSLEKARASLREIYRTKRGFVERTFRDRFAQEEYAFGRGARKLTREALNKPARSIRFYQATPDSDYTASRMELEESYALAKRGLRTQKATSLFDLEASQERELGSIYQSILDAQHRMNLYSMQMQQLGG